VPQLDQAGAIGIAEHARQQQDRRLGRHARAPRRQGFAQIGERRLRQRRGRGIVENPRDPVIRIEDRGRGRGLGAVGAEHVACGVGQQLEGQPERRMHGAIGLDGLAAQGIDGGFERLERGMGIAEGGQQRRRQVAAGTEQQHQRLADDQVGMAVGGFALLVERDNARRRIAGLERAWGCSLNIVRRHDECSLLSPKQGSLNQDTITSPLTSPLLRKRESRATALSLAPASSAGQALDPRFRGGDKFNCDSFKRILL
jgi:hypothetical protein